MIVHHELKGPEQAPVLVLSNSLGTDLSMWDEQLPALAERFRVLRYDQRGHGGTQATPGPYDLQLLGNDVLELLDHLGIRRAHFAGVSLGGMTGMWLAQNTPERIDRLALLCTSADLGPASNWRQRAELVRQEGTTAVAENSLSRWFTPALAERADIVDKYSGMINAASDEGYAGCCEAIAAMDLTDRLGGIIASTLVVAGDQDPATPPAHAERIAEAVPGARLETLPQAAHLANVEQADTVNRLLVEHFERGGA